MSYMRRNHGSPSAWWNIGNQSHLGSFFQGMFFNFLWRTGCSPRLNGDIVCDTSAERMQNGHHHQAALADRGSARTRSAYPTLEPQDQNGCHFTWKRSMEFFGIFLLDTAAVSKTGMLKTMMLEACVWKWHWFCWAYYKLERLLWWMFPCFTSSKTLEANLMTYLVRLSIGSTFLRRLLEVFEVERYNTGFGGFSWGIMAA